QWARYLGLHALLLPLPAFTDPVKLQAYAALLAGIQEDIRLEHLDLWVRVAPQPAGWHAWQVLRQASGVRPGNKLHVVLDLEGLSEDAARWGPVWQRWFGESLRALLLPSTLFRRDFQG